MRWFVCSCLIQFAWIAVLLAARVPLAHVYVRESTKDVISLHHSRERPWDEHDLHKCLTSMESDLQEQNSTALRYSSNDVAHTYVRLRGTPSLKIVRGGKDGSPKLFGLGLPKVGFAWACGLGLSFRELLRKKSSVKPPQEKQQVALLKDPAKAVLLQGFDWELMPDKPRLYSNLVKEMPALAEAGVNVVWFPPPSSSADPHGYMPGKWYEIPHKEQLLEAVGAARTHGIVSMVDVVLNHRTATRVSNVTGEWTSFEAPDWEEWAVVRNDWKCKPDDDVAFCPANCSTCGAADTGENACFAPDVDHTSPRVQADVDAWLRWLQEALGFGAFRFDNTKGYAPEAVARYVAATRPLMSVGEYFDTNRDLLTTWLRRAGGAVSAFDFGLRYKLKDAVAADDFSPLRDAFFGPMLHYAPGSAVTFLDNHDTAGELHDRFGGQAALEQGYAFLLTHPGVPCVFWADWLGPVRETIRRLVAVRAQAGVTSRSSWEVVHAGPGLYAAFVTPAPLPGNPAAASGQAAASGTAQAVAAAGGLAMKLGSGAWSPNQGLPERRWQSAASGSGWAVWTRIPARSVSAPA